MSRSGFAVALGVCAFLLPGCSKDEEATAVATGPVSVATATARIDNLVDRVSGTGTVVPSQAADWTIYAPEAGEIVELPKQEGEPVKTGDLLVRFDIESINASVSAAELALGNARSRVDAAKKELAKLEPLDAKGMVARQDMQAAKDTLLAAQSAETIATGAVEAAKSRRAVTEVRARFNGTLTKSWHAKGDAVAGGAGDPILRVVDGSRLQILATLPVSDINRIEPGQAALVASPGGDPAPATVVMRPTITDRTVLTGDVRLAFAGPTPLAIDAPVDLQILIDQHPDVLVIPRAAILKDEDGTIYVLIAGDDNVAHRRVITLGFTTKDRVQVVNGLTTGERVVTSGLDQIADGSQILIER